MNSNNPLTKWLPFIGALLITGGILLGYFIAGNRSQTPFQQKLNRLYDIIENDYVDEIDLDSLLESQIPSLLKSLDPHSSYIPAADLEEVNGELEGSFGGIGIQFQVMNDTICVVEVITGGPAEKVGVMAGDRIIAVDTINLINRHISDEDVRSMLRGEKGTHVTIKVKRNNAAKPLMFDITRGDIPMISVDASYMIDPKTGYVKVNRFSRTTFGEFLQAISQLRYLGAESLIIDLRGNGGGYMEPAVLMANEFLPAYSKIVMTKGRDADDNSTILSDGTGAFTDMPLVVLVDEFTASSSEIFSGAIQDNDRGLIVGRRTFGKGLVQRPIMLPDSSEVRLTVQRYYTPSGRCIQKNFQRGKADEYDDEIIERYNRGEIFNADSINLNTAEIFHTMNGRTVYGSGGIMPDVFVPSDTTGYSSYYVNVSNAGLLQKYAYELADLNRDEFSKAKTVDELLKMLPSDATLLQSFVSYAAQKGVPARWHYINISAGLIVNYLKALIARDTLGFSASYEIYNSRDKVVEQAMKLLSDGQAEIPVRYERLKNNDSQEIKEDE
ncbi:MAG: S41 family peptidase [Muribaculaceae bacterium]|nr:S41 family peptidase [Muribaculaceae bacterium]